MVAAEEKCGVREFCRQTSDPETCSNVSHVTNQGVVIPVVNQFPQTGIEEAEERFLASTVICDQRPGVSVKKRNIPLNLGVELRIVGDLCPFEAAIRNLDVELWFGRELAEDGSLVLHGVRGNKKHAVALVRHGAIEQFVRGT